MQFKTCNLAEHSKPILDIFNDAIVTSTALYDYRPRSPADMTAWFGVKTQYQFPVIGVFDGNELMGFASYGRFRPYDAYKYTVEHSVYVHRLHRGKGLGEALLGQIIEAATAQHYHVLVGAIDAANHASIALHEKLGFSPCGQIKQAAFKFDQWLDLALYQKILPTPLQPNEEI